VLPTAIAEREICSRLSVPNVTSCNCAPHSLAFEERCLRNICRLSRKWNLACWSKRPWPSSEASAAMRLRKLTSARLLRHGNRKALQDTPNYATANGSRSHDAKRQIRYGTRRNSDACGQLQSQPKEIPARENYCTRLTRGPLSGRLPAAIMISR
jgi:hypothetical protein